VRRFFIGGELADTVTITGADARHIGRGLRLGPGAELVVVDKAGRAARVEITSVETAAVHVAVRERLAGGHEPPVKVSLAQGLPKGDKFEYIVQKAVELGATAIVPLACENCSVRYDAAKQGSRRERWQKIAAEAAKQCGRDAVPGVEPVMALTEALAAADDKTDIIMLYEGQGGAPLREILAGSGASSYLLFIGPEGGFSPAEVELCRSRGARVATLGPRILRTETASLAALSIVMYEKGDLGNGR
jgi:16S rRNA (uracil1498-N3)-methyltransferase